MKETRRRTLRVLAVAAATGLLLVSAAAAGETERRKLSGPVEFDGVLCKRYAWLHEDGTLSGCTLARDSVINGQELPEGTRFGLTEDGVLDCVFLPRDTKIQGHVYRGHGHGYQTCFHRNGRLSFGNLAQSETIQGVPCRKSSFWIWILVGNAGVQFHDNGALKACLLAADFEHEGQSIESGQRVELDPFGDLVTKDTGTP